MYVLKLKLNRLVLYKSPSSGFVLSVLGYRSLKKGVYDTFFINFKALFNMFERDVVQVRFNPSLKRILKARLAFRF